uniref:Uncharacterized protein n=1 Tax=Cucumis sativus TaxID=3659 RepID=A0A0A0K3G3_CUCSA
MSFHIGFWLHSLVFTRFSVSGLSFLLILNCRGEAERLEKDKAFAFYIEAQVFFLRHGRSSRKEELQNVHYQRPKCFNSADEHSNGQSLGNRGNQTLSPGNKL